jgi:flagellar hook assembly protein FlgD
VSLVIYDAQGRRVRTLVNKKLNPGIHNFSWDGKNTLGQAVVSGVYMLNMIQGEFASTRSIQLLK